MACEPISEESEKASHMATGDEALWAEGSAPVKALQARTGVAGVGGTRLELLEVFEQRSDQIGFLF